MDSKELQLGKYYWVIDKKGECGPYMASFTGYCPAGYVQFGETKFASERYNFVRVPEYSEMIELYSELNTSKKLLESMTNNHAQLAKELSILRNKEVK